jgi:ABC-2 type transport system permease protein
MAVYKRTYRGYSGGFTTHWSRFLVLYRYARRNLFKSKFLTAFFVICFFYPLLCLLGIYANDHMSAFSFLGQRSNGPLFKIDGKFFLLFLSGQSSLAFILTAFIGPGLISPDLSNGALTLYLCRPLSRFEYVLGKMSVLAIVLSWVTWIPGLVLFFVQASLSGWDWTMHNFWIAVGIVLGSWIWILSIALLAMALSAWVKWRIAAGALLLGVLFLGAGFAQAINRVLQTQQGYLIDVSKLTNIIWQDLFHDSAERALPAGEAWFGLLAFAALCFYLLMKKIRANEVVR